MADDIYEKASATAVKITAPQPDQVTVIALKDLIEKRDSIAAAISDWQILLADMENKITQAQKLGITADVAVVVTPLKP